MPSSRMCRKPSQDEWSKTLDTTEAAMALGKSLSQVDLQALDSAHMDPHLCDLLENEFPNEDMKLIKRMDSHLTDVPRPWPPDLVR